MSARGKVPLDVVDVEQKKRGPRTVPWGTPDWPRQGSETEPSTRTRWVRPCRKEADQERRGP